MGSQRSLMVCILLPPVTKLRQGNVFTPVCDSVHRGVSVLACTTGHMTRGSLFRGSLSWGVSVQGGVSVWGVSAQGVYVRETPQYGNEQAVRILLECILVIFRFTTCM